MTAGKVFRFALPPDPDAPIRARNDYTQDPADFVMQAQAQPAPEPAPQPWAPDDPMGAAAGGAPSGNVGKTEAQYARDAYAAAKADGNAEAATHYLRKYQSLVAAGDAGDRFGTGVNETLASAGRGLKGLVGMGDEGETATAQELQKAAMAGAGTAGEVGNITGELAALAPSMLVGGPVGAVGGALARGPALVRTIAALAKPAAKMGAAAGATRAAITEGDLAKRATEGVEEGLIAGAFPFAAAGVGAAARGVRNIAQRAAAPFSERAAEAIAERALPRAMAQAVERSGALAGGKGFDELERVAAAIPARGSRIGTVTVPETTAVAAQSAPLAAVERGARARSPTPFQQVDESAATARWKALDTMLDSKATTEVQRQAMARVGEEVEPMLAQIAPQQSRRMLNEFADEVRAQLKSATSPTARADLKQMLKDVEDWLPIKSGPVPPRLLHDIRREFMGDVKGRGGPLASRYQSTSNEPLLMRMKDKIDDIYEKAIGDGWANWRRRYAAAAQETTKAQAGRGVRNAIVDETTGVARAGETTTGQPRLTRAGLGRAMASQNVGKAGGLEPGVARTLKQAMASLERGDLLQKVKGSATGGGGSNTATDLLATTVGAGAGSALGDVPIVGALLGASSRLGRSRTASARDRLLVDALSDPAKFQAMMQALRTRQMARPGAASYAASMPLLALGGSE
jgi:hypothetical protein